MFQTSQCVTSIFELLLSAGSGSCIRRTRLCVPGGTCDHLSSGDGAFGPAACVYLSGMTPPSSQAVLVMISGGVCGPRPRPWPPPAGGPCARSARLIAAVSVAVIRTFALMRSPFSLAAGPHPRRELTLMLAFGSHGRRRFSLALGPHPQRERTLMLAFGSYGRRRFSLRVEPHPKRELTLMPRLGYPGPRLGIAAGARAWTSLRVLAFLTVLPVPSILPVQPVQPVRSVTSQS